MSYRIAFRFERDNYSAEVRKDSDRLIRQTLHEKLDRKGIQSSRIYTPSRNTIKVIFQSEKELNKVLDNEDHFKAAFLYPKISISLKASRTVFCGGFDTALLANNTKENIKDLLEANHWKIRGVYIMRSGTSFKYRI